MQSRQAADKSLAYFLLRLVLGLNIAMHGLSRVIAGPWAFAEATVHQFASTPLPAWPIHLFALCIPWVELVVGLAVLLGAATRMALVVGTLEIAALTFGTVLRQDWDAAGLQLGYALVYTLLLAFREYNAYAIDSRFQSMREESQRRANREL